MKADASISETNPAVPGNDEMIEQVNVEEPAGREGLRGHM
jgi:hypothetical protein